MAKQQVVSYAASPTASRFHQSRARIKLLVGPVGPVSGDTEYFTGSGWERIDSYNPDKPTPIGEVSFADPDNPVLSLALPQDYIVTPQDSFHRFHNKHSLDMVISPDHKVPYYTRQGEFKTTTGQSLADSPGRKQIPVNFVTNQESLKLSDLEIRLAVAINADGHWVNTSNTVLITLRKRRKRERLTLLLDTLNIPYTHHIYQRDKLEHRYSFKMNYNFGGKRFNKWWWELSASQLQIVLDEVTHWGGLADHKEQRYYSNHKCDADYIQYVAHACGRRATIRKENYDSRGKPHWQETYIVQISTEHSPKGKVFVRSDTTSIETTQSEDGKQYCFKTEAGFFLARRNGCVFITGNSGSSTACIFDFILRAIRQTPDPDGVRRHTVLIARNSYPKLKTTVKKTLEHWIPDSTGFELSGQAPISGDIIRPLPDGTKMHLEIILMAFQDASKIEEDLRSFEYSSLWINEAKESNQLLLKYGQQRLGRAPAKISDPSDPEPNGPNPYPPLFDGCDEPTILLDTNMYDDDEWLYKFFHVTHANNPNIVKFEQPGALIECETDDPDGRYFDFLDTYLKENPLAENIRWLPAEYDYYWNILETAPETVWTDVLNRVGSTQSGKPVFSSYYYTDRTHYKPYYIKPNPAYPLLIGVDWGVRYSAYVFCQYYNGGLKILTELVIKDLGLVQQMEDYVVPMLNTQFAECVNRMSIADPAGKARDPVDGVPQYTLLSSRWGLPCKLAISNSPSARIDAMKNLLRREGGLELSSNISTIRKGFQGKYKYKEVRGAAVSGEIRYKEEPDKNAFSHPMDAVCYVALDVTSEGTLHSMEDQYAQDNTPLVLL